MVGQRKTSKERLKRLIRVWVNSKLLIYFKLTNGKLKLKFDFFLLVAEYFEH